MVKGGTTLNAVKSMTPKTYLKKVYSVYIKMHKVRNGILQDVTFLSWKDCIGCWNMGERNVPNLVKKVHLKS